MLVALRLVTGWHFFNEGLNHFAEHGWSSVDFLRQAKGPLSPLYLNVVPDFHQFDDVMHGEHSNEMEGVDIRDAERVKQPGEVLCTTWEKYITEDWDKYVADFKTYNTLDAKQKELVDQVLARRKRELTAWLGATRPAIADHVHEWQRMRADAKIGGSKEVPFMRKRIGSKVGALRSEAAGFAVGANKIERGLREELNIVLTSEQRKFGEMPADPTSLDRIDSVMKYAILIVGVCLMLGLFTRTAAVAGVLFLLSIVASQPFWVVDSIPTYYQWVELVALAALATTHVGRWGGLDYFVHYLFFDRTRVETNESYA